MNLKVGKSNGRTYLSIAHGYRDENGHVRTKTIKSLGYLEDLAKDYPDPIAHFKSVVAEMNKKEADENPPAIINLDKNKLIEPENSNRRNLGYSALSKIYHELGLNVFFYNHSRKLKTEYNFNSIMKLLIFSRILFPGSKKNTFENKDLYFEKFDFTLDDVYRSLTFLNKEKNSLQRYLHGKMKELYGRTTELVYYDVTNYYFEIDEPDKLRKKGVSKEHRPNPIVQMGLFMDTKGMPVSYGLFAGNTRDCKTMIPLMTEMKKEYGMGRVIIVADKGINTAANIVYSHLRGDGYVYSQTIRGGNKELKDYALDKGGYRANGDENRIKSRLYAREIVINDVKGKREKIRIDEKQVIIYSLKYDKRAKAEREPALQKAKDLVNNPGKYNKATSCGAAKYVKNLQFDKDTGEIATTTISRPVLNEEKIREEELYDGYYAIVTSENKKTDEEIIEIYRGLWRIEESFRVTKSDLVTRPVYMSREDHIEAHFLICFLALAIARILEYRLDRKYSISRISESLRKASCSILEENWHVLDYTDDIIHDLNEKLSIDLNHKYLRLGDIRKILGTTKKC